jgi:hypothetical protein
MRLPWRNKPEDKSGEALKAARSNLRKVERRSEEVSRIVNELKSFGDRNHFAEQLEAAIFRQKGSAP